jgi:DnaK suppressor protein
MAEKRKKKTAVPKKKKVTPKPKRSKAMTARSGKKAAKKPAVKSKKKVARAAPKAAAPARPSVAKKKQTKKAAPRRRKTPAELRKFKKALAKQREELLAAYHAAKGDSRNRIEDGTEDYIDYAVSSYDREFLLSLTELEQKQLELVEDALKRLERRTDYGSCAHCREEIPSKRLEVQPWARYCLRCQELDEQGILSADEDDADSDDEDDDSAADNPLNRDDMADEEEGERGLG